MSDRLISTERLKEALAKNRNYHALNAREVSLLNRTIQIVDEQPTAYDIDEKIKQLEAEDDNGDYYVDGFVDIDRIKEILKGGAK